MISKERLVDKMATISTSTSGLVTVTICSITYHFPSSYFKHASKYQNNMPAMSNCWSDSQSCIYFDVSNNNLILMCFTISRKRTM